MINVLHISCYNASIDCNETTTREKIVAGDINCPVIETGWAKS